MTFQLNAMSAAPTRLNSQPIMPKVGTTSGQRRVIPAGTPPRTLPEIMASYERIIIIQALQINGCSRSRTAISLGITRRHLYRRMEILKIDLDVVTMGRSGRSRSNDERKS